jgi:hypothetical protein
MAHFAEINEENMVTRVLVVPDEFEDDGQNYLANVIGLGGTWIQTSYNGTIRKNYAGVGYTYNEELDAFVLPKVYDKWILNEETCKWEAPIPYPINDKQYVWNDNRGEWEEVEQ